MQDAMESSASSLSKFTSSIEELPSIVVSDILGYLGWSEKLCAVLALPSWKPHLHTPAAWPFVVYGNEMEENVYFAKERRANFLISLKKYGKYMRYIELAFGFPLARSRQQILRAIAEHCAILKSFRFSPHENQECRNVHEMTLTKSDIAEFVSVLQSCKSLQYVGLISPCIVWTQPIQSETNILLEVSEAGQAAKITELHLTSKSLIDHEDYLTDLQLFTKLQKLTVRREKINNGILLHLVESGLQEICLFQDEELALTDARQLDEKFWCQVLKVNPQFKVDLILQYILVIKDSFVPNMPLRSLVLDDLVNIVTKGVIDHLVSHYKDTLESFTYTNFYLENFESGDSRLPAALVTMVTKCKQMHTIRYGFPLSSTTILLLVKTRKLRQLFVPSAEVSYEFDWAIQEDWDEDMVLWLKKNYRGLKLLEDAVSEQLGFKWRLQDESLSLEKSMGLSLNL